MNKDCEIFYIWYKVSYYFGFIVGFLNFRVKKGNLFSFFILDLYIYNRLIVNEREELGRFFKVLIVVCCNLLNFKYCINIYWVDF